MGFSNLTIKQKTLYLISIAGVFFAIVVGAVFIYNEYAYLKGIQKEDEKFANYAYHQIYELQQITDTATLNSFIAIPGFADAFSKRDRQTIIRLWNDKWNSLHHNNIDILQLHEANGKSFIRMHELNHFGDMIALKRPMIAHIHKTHRPVSAFEVGVYGLAYRVAIPIIINGKYEGALEIGSDPRRSLEEVHERIGIPGIILVKNNPVIKAGSYQRKLGNLWIDSEIGMSDTLLNTLKTMGFEKSTSQINEISNNYATTVLPLYNFQNQEIATAIFIRDNTAKTYNSYIKILTYGVGALLLLFTILFLINKWIGYLLDQLQNSNDELSSTLNQLHRYQSVLDQHSIVSKSDIYGVITYVNDRFCEISGYTREELIGSPHSIVRHPDTPLETFKGMWDNLIHKESWTGILKNLKKDGSAYYIDALITPLFDEQGNISEYIAVRHDITELMENRDELQNLATTDMLTHLGNRLSLLKDISMAKRPYLALLDVDRFGEINDFYGQATGDKVLTRIGEILSSVSDSRVKLYRLNSDTFAMMADNIDKDEFTSLAEKMACEIRIKPLIVSFKSIPLQITIGISFEPSLKLIQTADMALTIAKKQKNHIIIFKEELSLEKEYSDNIYWTLKIKNALEEHRIICYYQPIVNNNTGQIEKYESLVRLVELDGTVIPPYQFLHIAKKSKQYIEISKHVIHNAFERFKDTNLYFSINLTIEDILSEELNHYLQEMIDRYNIGSRLVIELVESEGIENYEEVIDFIEKIKKFGCCIAIDDFGTGYSNFEYLLRLKPDYIKIDGSMIRTINQNVSSIEVVRTIIDFARRTGIKTIGEYVCDESVSNTVITLGIDYSQGYYHGEPKSDFDI